MEARAIVPLPMTADPAASCTPIAGQPPVVRAVRALLDCVAQSRVVVVVAEPLAARVRDVLTAHDLSAVAVIAVAASADRRQAITAGLEHVVQEPLSQAPVLVHDVLHPLAPSEVSGRVIAAVRTGYPVVVPVVPVTDSVKSVDGRGAVVATIDRATLQAVQYPRGFTAATLAELLSNSQVADELEAALAAGQPVVTVDGHEDAVRFALPADADLLEAVIASRQGR